MATSFIGEHFNVRDYWGRQEVYIIEAVKRQVAEQYPDSDNLIINTTWFGPQFNQTSWRKYQSLIQTNTKFDKLFWLSSSDPICLVPEQMEQIESSLAVQEQYYLGNFDNSAYEFNIGSIASYQDFVQYDVDDLLLKDPKYLFVNYNRKPKPHRINFVQKLKDNNLLDLGIVTLGKNDVGYDITGGKDTDLYLTIDDKPEEYTMHGKYNLHTSFGGIPYDVCSLGRLDIWQQHFLNIVSETEFNPWDNIFVSEKTWKPIIGLRPFVINGQLKIYDWLRNNGFRTFNHYFSSPIEGIKEFEIHDSIIAVIQALSKMPASKIVSLYNDMLPDLKYNKLRFEEFAQEQLIKVDHLF